MQRSDNRLTSLAREAVEPMGYELVGVDFFHRGGRRSALLRVYIDQPEGVTLDDCAAVSHQLSGVLDVENPITGEYDLEVSSPGLDRPLFTAAHFARFQGHQARIKLMAKREGQRHFKGILRGVDDDTLRLEVGGAMIEIPLLAIESARLVPEF